MNKVRYFIKEYGWLVAWIVIVLTVKATNILGINVIVGNSMEPNYSNFNVVLSSSLAKPGIDYGDVVVVTAEIEEKKQVLIKRVVALPGDTVEIVGGVLYLNDQMVDETSLVAWLDTHEKLSNHNEKIKLSDNEYYVMGDNRTRSYDSRVLGPIKKSDINGAILLQPDNSAIYKK